MASFTITPTGDFTFSWNAQYLNGQKITFTIGNEPPAGVAYRKEGFSNEFTVSRFTTGFYAGPAGRNISDREYSITLKFYNVADPDNDFIDVELIQLYQNEMYASSWTVDISTYTSGSTELFFNSPYMVYTSDNWLWTQSNGSDQITGFDKYIIGWDANPNLSGRYGDVFVDTLDETAAVTVYQPGTQQNVYVTPTNISFNKFGGTAMVDLTFFSAPYTVSIPSSAQSWLSYTEDVLDTDSVTLEFTCLSNTSASRSATVTMAGNDPAYGTCTLSVFQKDSGLSVSPSSLVFSVAGETKTVTFDNIPASGLIVDDDVPWASATVSGSGAFITAESNTSTSVRTDVISFADRDDASNYAEVQLIQPGLGLTVSPTSLSFIATGQTKTVSLQNVPSAGINHTEPNWITVYRDPNQYYGYEITAEANNTGATRLGTVKFQEVGNPYNYVEVALSQESTPQFSATPSTVAFDPLGETVTITLQNLPTGTTDVGITARPNWVYYKKNSNTEFRLAVYSGGDTPRSGIVTFTAYGDATKTFDVAVSQNQAGQWSISPSTVNFIASGGTETLTLANTPNGGIDIDGTPVSSDRWWTASVYSSVSGGVKDRLDVTATANSTTSRRNGTVQLIEKGTNNWLSTDWPYASPQMVTLWQLSQDAADLGQLIVSPESLRFPKEGDTLTATLTNVPAGGVSVTTKPSWATATISGNTVSITVPLNPRNEGRYPSGAYVQVVDNNDSTNYVRIYITQEPNNTVEAEPNPVLFGVRGETKTVTITAAPVGGTIAYQNQPEWITVSGDATNGYSLTASSNELSDQPRTGTIRFYDTGYTANYVDVVLTQDGNGVFAVEPTTLEFISGGQSKTVTLSNVPANGFNVNRPQWISTVTSGNTVTITATGNTTNANRTGTIIFTDINDSSNTCSVSVTQYYGVSANPDRLTFYSEGGSQTVTLTNEGDVVGHYVNWLRVIKISAGVYTIGPISQSYTGETRTTEVYFADPNDANNKCYIYVTQYGTPEPGPGGTMTITPNSMSFASYGETKTAAIVRDPAAPTANYAYRITGNHYPIVVDIDGGVVSCTMWANTTQITRTTTLEIYDVDTPNVKATISISQSPWIPTGNIEIGFADTDYNLDDLFSCKGETKTYVILASPLSGLNASATDGFTASIVEDYDHTQRLVISTTRENHTTDFINGQVLLQARNNPADYYAFSVSQYTNSDYIHRTKKQQMPVPYTKGDVCFDYTGGTQKVFVWYGPLQLEEATINVPFWITYTISEDTEGSYLVLTAERNSIGDQYQTQLNNREENITISGYDINNNYVTTTIRAFQYGIGGLNCVLDPHLLDLSRGQTGRIKFLDEYSWGYPIINITAPDWVSYSMSNRFIDVTPSLNTTGKSRYGALVVDTQTLSYGSDGVMLFQGVNALMRVSSDDVVFSSAGETKTLNLSNVNGPLNYRYPKWITMTVNGNHITLTASENRSYYSRGGVINITQVNDPNYCVKIYVTQLRGEGEEGGVICIWRDMNYVPDDVVEGEDYLYHLTGTGLDFYGLSAAMPTENGSYPGPINISRLVESYLTSSTSNLFSYVEGQWSILDPAYEVNFYHRGSGGQDELISEFSFWNDWSGYKMSYNFTQSLNEPINKKGCQNMLIPFCVYCNNDSTFSVIKKNNETETLINLGTPFDNFCIYSATYSGVDKVGFYNGDQLLFSYDMTHCGDGYFVYRNRFGGWDSFLIEGNIKKEETYDKEQFATNGLNTSTDTWNKRTDQNNIKTTYEAHTGWLSDREADRLVYHLLSSPEVYFKELYVENHRLTPNKMIAVNLTNSKAEYKKFKNGHNMVKYTITFEESKNKQVQR